MVRGTPLPPSPTDYPTPSGHVHTSGEILARNCDLLNVYLNPRHAAFTAFHWGMSEESIADGLDSHTSFQSRDHLTTHEDLPHEFEAHPQTIEAIQTPQYRNAAEEPFKDNSFVSSTPASSSFSTSSSPLSHASRPTCRHCGRSFLTNTNRNRHMRDDCPKRAKAAGAGFRCRNAGCGKASSRKDNRDKHERESCAKRYK
jgi:hypothetical protein